MNSEPAVNVRHLDDVLDCQLDDAQWLVVSDAISVEQMEFHHIPLLIERLQFEFKLLAPSGSGSLIKRN